MRHGGLLLAAAHRDIDRLTLLEHFTRRRLLGNDRALWAVGELWGLRAESQVELAEGGSRTLNGESVEIRHLNTAASATAEQELRDHHRANDRCDDGKAAHGPEAKTTAAYASRRTTGASGSVATAQPGRLDEGHGLGLAQRDGLNRGSRW
ncbi:unannotated protein [freshwater metagenome]|uniref:Unannotated protein n=1 Tax=freshwater metagenome TaxID=449393 RepID=A0A6J6UI60_9ZZZZ